MQKIYFLIILRFNGKIIKTFHKLEFIKWLIQETTWSIVSDYKVDSSHMTPGNRMNKEQSVINDATHSDNAFVYLCKHETGHAKKHNTNNDSKCQHWCQQSTWIVYDK